MTAVPFDTLKFVEKLEAGGFSHQQAKAAAEAFAEATSQELATKGDIATLRVELQTGFQLLEQRMTIKLGGLTVVATGVILAAIKFLGHG